MSENNLAGKVLSGNLSKDVDILNRELAVDINFDIVSRDVVVGGKTARFYFIDGFCKDEVMQKLLEFLMELQADFMPHDAVELLKNAIPYVEVDKEKHFEKMQASLLSGMFLLLIDGFQEAILLDVRTYPARSVSEPEKDKVLRGSKDGFVETIVFNTALIRRRIRDTDLRMEMLSIGKTSKTDVVVCYMDSRVDKKLLNNIKYMLETIQVDALNMNQESLAECLVPGKWLNPFPKFKYTERPDAAAAQVLEGNIILLVDNSPSAMVLPTTIFKVIEEADDFYFPPLTGTYLKLTRFLIAVMTYILTPTFLLFMNNVEWIPKRFEFVILKEQPNVSLIWQFLILELAIDGLKLAAVNSPSMLSTPLSVMAALVLGEFSVNSGWFSSEVMLYMAFVAIANYTQSNYELGYALKFMRILSLLLTQFLNLWGYIAGIVLTLSLIAFNRTVCRRSYLYPLIPFDGKALKRVLVRNRIEKI